MDHLKQTLELEIMMQSQILKRNLQILADAPKGKLFIRQRLKSSTYYQIEKIKTPAGWKNIQRNITGDTATILSLAEKALAEQTVQACKNNLELLQKTLSKYTPYQRDDLIGILPQNIRMSSRCEASSKLKIGSPLRIKNILLTPKNISTKQLTVS